MTAPATMTLYDDIYADDGTALANATVTCVLDSAVQTFNGGLIAAKTQTATTNSAGHVSFTVIANDLLTPSGSAYIISVPSIGRTWQAAPQSANGTSQRSTAGNVLVSTPQTLAPAGSLSGLYAGPADLAVRSITLGSPYTNLLADGVTATPAGVMTGKDWDWGGFAYNLLGFGVTGSGSDESTKINQGLAAVPSGSVVYWPTPAVRYAIAATLTPGANQAHYGAGRFTSVIQRLTNMNAKMFACEGLQGMSFEDLCFDLNDANQSSPGTIPALRFDATAHYHSVFRCRVINAKSFTIYTFTTGAQGIGNSALVARYRDNEVTCISGAAFDVFIPVAQGGYTMGNKILFGTSGTSADFNVYECTDHPVIGNAVDMTGGAAAACMFEVSSSTRSPLIGNVAIGSGSGNSALVGFDIHREGDNGANAREQLDASLTANQVWNCGRGYRLRNGASGIAAIVDTQIAGGLIDTCNQGIECNSGTIVGLTIDGVSFRNTARPLIFTVPASYLRIVNCNGLNPGGQITTPAVPAAGVDAQNTSGFDCMFYVAGGTVTGLKIGLPPPVIVAISTSTTGGTLAGGATYGYIVTMVDNRAGETAVSAEATIAVPAGTNTNTVTIKWYPSSAADRPSGSAPGWNVYGRTASAELKMTPSLVGVGTFTDDGSVTPAGALPAGNHTQYPIGLTPPASVLVPANMMLSWAGTVAPTWTAFAS